LSTDGIALNANVAINSKGQSTSNTGVNVFFNAENCMGISTGGSGRSREAGDLYLTV
jgi:hypothetical protein